MRKLDGFTLIEVIMFMVVVAILAATILLSVSTSLTKAPIVFEDMIATQTAKKCIEWFIGQRRLNGYTAISCPSSTVPSFCSAPTGFTVAVSITCTTINSDANYQTITVTVSDKGNAKLTTLIANY